MQLWNENKKINIETEKREYKNEGGTIKKGKINEGKINKG